MEEHVEEYNSLLEESPFFQNMAQKVIAESGLRAAQRMVTTVVRARFPNLAEFAKERISNVDSMDSLETLLRQIVTAPDEIVAKELLDTFVE